MPYVCERVRDIAAQLKKAGFGCTQECAQHAWWLLESLTGKSLTELMIATPPVLTEKHNETLDTWLKKIVHEHMPPQYLWDGIPFAGVTISIAPPVLIPRPETEWWVAGLIDEARALKARHLRILDMFTGSGCIAIAFAKAIAHARVYASDIDETALRCARANNERNGTSATFSTSDIFAALSGGEHYDIIVGNPPYVAPDEWNSLAASVRCWEDKRALVADDDGYALIKTFVAQARSFLRSEDPSTRTFRHNLVFEIGHKQGAHVREILEKHGYCDVIIEKDVRGKDRVARSRLA